MSVTQREAQAVGERFVIGADALSAFGSALSQAGLRVEACREATAQDVQDLHSSWAKRLGIPARRAAWMLSARKP